MSNTTCVRDDKTEIEVDGGGVVMLKHDETCYDLVEHKTASLFATWGKAE